MTAIAMSSGHGKLVRGASGYLDEVDEARRMVEAVAAELISRGVMINTFHDDISTTQNENLERIVNWHNAQQRDLDISVHFNAYETCDKPMGTEVLYVSQPELAEDLSAVISEAGGFLDRGPKERTDLYFLNNTNRPAVLIETCFVDSSVDAELYKENFDDICTAIADVIGYDEDAEEEDEGDFYAVGKCSWFGGPQDGGVSPDEGLAFLYEYEDAPHLFLDEQPPNTTGLARRLDPSRPYIACRWNYDMTDKEMLADPHNYAQVFAKKTGRQALAWPADWGPHEDTGRVADLSQGLMHRLGIDTDDEVEVIYPVKRK